MYVLTQPDESTTKTVESLIDSGDFAGAVDAVAASWPHLVWQHGARLRALITRIPEQQWRHNAWIIAALGASYRTSPSSRSAALPLFELAERLIAAGCSPAADLPAIQLHHAASLRGLGRLDSALGKAESARSLLRTELESTLPVRLSRQAAASLQLGLINLHLGNFTLADGQLRLASGLSEHGVPRSDLVEGLGALAYTAYAAGDFERAERILGRARDAAGETGLLRTVFGAPAMATEALIAVDRNDGASAGELTAALAVSAHRSDWEPLALYARAASTAINGRLIEALDLQRRCSTVARDWENTPAIRALAETLRAGLHLHLGEVDRAAELLDGIHPIKDHAACPGALRASIRFAAGQFSDCLAELDGCMSIADSHSTRTMIDVLLLSAAAKYELGRPVAGDVSFDRALYLGSQTGIRVPFLVIPRITMLRMLNRAADRYQPDAVHRLLDELRVGSARSGELIEPLSERELDIAQHLFEDKTINQIAAELFISANTVKTHVRSIYRKLAATNRKDAIKRVHELGLNVRITRF